MAKYCKQCGKLNENPLLKLCREHYYQEQLDNPKQTQIKQISNKRRKRLSGYSEKDMFREILIERQDNGLLTCEVCNKQFRIEDAQPVSFAHILAKGLYPALRLFKNNIAIVCPNINTNSCHNKLDSILSGNKKELEQRILNLENINIKNYYEKNISL